VVLKLAEPPPLSIMVTTCGFRRIGRIPHFIVTGEVEVKGEFGERD